MSSLKKFFGDSEAQHELEERLPIIGQGPKEKRKALVEKAFESKGPGMATILTAALKRCCEQLREHGLSVLIGRPSDAVDLALWPWQLDHLPVLIPRPAPVSSTVSSALTQAPIILDLRFLLIVNKDAESAIQALILAQAVLSRSRVMQINDTQVKILSESLALDHLAALFTAAGISLSLSSAHVARCPPVSSPHIICSPEQERTWQKEPPRLFTNLAGWSSTRSLAKAKGGRAAAKN